MTSGTMDVVGLCPGLDQRLILSEGGQSAQRQCRQREAEVKCLIHEIEFP